MKDKFRHYAAYVTQERINEVAIFLILFLCYIYTFPRWADWNQNSRFYLVQAIVDYGTLSIDCCQDNTGDYAFFEGHAYSDKAPGLSFLGVPPYAVYRLVASLGPVETALMRVAESEAMASTLNPEGTGIRLDKLHTAVGMIISTVIFVSLPAALLGAVMYRFLGAFSSHSGYRIIVVLVYGLATIAFPYAGSFYAHQLVAALLFIPFAMAFWLNSATATGWRLFAIGFMLGYAVISEYPVAIIAGPIFLYLFYQLPHKLRIGWVILGGLIPGLMAASLNFAIFHTPMPVAYYYSVEWKDVHGITSFQPTAFWGITGSTYRGIFFISPVLLLSFIGLAYLWRQRRFWAEALVTTFVVVSFIIFNSSLKTWAGGFSVGPRYLVPMIPFLAWPLIFFLERHGPTLWGKFLFGCLALWSFVSVWLLSLAGQRFPEDLPRAVWDFPLRDYAIPMWLQGDLARNLGVIIGFRGWWSLVPLIVMLMIIVIVWWLASRTADTVVSSRSVNPVSPN